MSKNEFICDCNIIHEDSVKFAKSKMPNDEIFYKLADFYKLIGDTTRCKILFVIDSHEMCVCDIAELINSTQSAVSHQLRVLKQSKLVKFRKEGKEVYYSLDDDHIIEIVKKGREHIEEL